MPGPELWLSRARGGRCWHHGQLDYVLAQVNIARLPTGAAARRGDRGQPAEYRLKPTAYSQPAAMPR
jgi:hypothetical protein